MNAEAISRIVEKALEGALIGLVIGGVVMLFKRIAKWSRDDYARWLKRQEEKKEEPRD